MQDKDTQLFLGISAGLSEAITSLVLAAGADPSLIETVRQEGRHRIANWEPEGIALDEQAAVASEAIALFDGIFNAAAARAMLREAEALATSRPARRRRRAGPAEPPGQVARR